MQVAEIDYIARAPTGKEVEDLNPKEVMRSLREKTTIEQVKNKYQKTGIPVPKHIFEASKQLKGTLEAILFDKDGNNMAKVPVSELAEKLSQTEGVHTILFDGIVTQRLLDIADSKKIKCLIGDRVSEVVKSPLDIKILELSNIVEEQK
jgi:DNA primase